MGGIKLPGGWTVNQCWDHKGKKSHNPLIQFFTPTLIESVQQIKGSRLHSGMKLDVALAHVGGVHEISSSINDTALLPRSASVECYHKRDCTALPGPAYELPVGVTRCDL